MVDRLGGNLPNRVRDGLLTEIGGEDLAMKEAIAQVLTVIRRTILEEGASAMEIILAGRIVAAWLQVQHTKMMDSSRQSNLRISQAEFHLHRIDSCDRQLLSAVRTRVQLRRMGLPQAHLVPETERQATTPFPDLLSGELAPPTSLGRPKETEPKRGKAESVTE
jgi:hypothetical protein